MNELLQNSNNTNQSRGRIYTRKKRLFSRMFTLCVAFLWCLSVTVYAQGGPGLVSDCTAGDLFTPACGFEKLIGVARNITNFAMLIAAPLAAIAFMWAGIMYFTAMGNEGQIKKAHQVFTSVLIGFIIVLSAWLLVKVILNTLAKPDISNILSLSHHDFIL